MTIDHERVPLTALNEDTAREHDHPGTSDRKTELASDQPESPFDIAPSSEVLRKHFQTALIELARFRRLEQPRGRYTDKTRDTVFSAGARAIVDGSAAILREISPFCDWADRNPAPPTPDLHVVHTGPGSGKSTAARALMVALVRATEHSSYSLGCVLLVHHVETAALAYRELNALLGNRVLVWTKEHDLDYGKREPRCLPEDLERYPLIVVTHAFYQGARGDLARRYAKSGTALPRVLTVIDEKINEVETYSVSHGDIARVDDRVKRNEQFSDDLDVATNELVKFIAGKLRGPDLESPLQDPTGWRRVVERLSWFATQEAGRHQRAQGARWRMLPFDEVFGFGRALTEGRAFIARSDEGKRGATFIGYERGLPQVPGMVLLDATANIDAITDLCSWRKPIEGPPERFDNLQIVHEPSVVTTTFKRWWNKRQNRRDYVAHIQNVILRNVEPGQRALIVCMKDVVVSDDLAGWSKYVGCFANGEITDFVWNLDDRRVAVAWWGGYGIGANDWVEADVVLLFDDYHLPRHALIATLQGLKDHKATEGALAELAASNGKRKHPQVDRLGTGHVLRWIKQLALRGRAREFSQDGICGRQKLVVTGKLGRFIENFNKLFPGAQIIKTAEVEKHQRWIDKLISVLLTTKRDILPASEVGNLMGTEWRKVSGDLRRHKSWDAMLANAGWRYVQRRGRKGSYFERLSATNAGS